MKKIIDGVLLFIVLGLTLFITVPKEEKYVRVANESIKKTVMIVVTYNDYDDYGYEVKTRISGAGVFVTQDGYILTCKHLFEYGGLTYDKRISIELSDGGLVMANVVALSQKSDLALLKQTFFRKVPYIQLADPRTLKIGQEVIAIGRPYGNPFVVSNGIISSLYIDTNRAYNVTLSNVASNPGNSGGPLINLKGELVGINSFIYSPVPGLPVFTGLGFSVQSGQCLEFLVYSTSKISPHKKYQWMRTWHNYKDWRRLWK